MYPSSERRRAMVVDIRKVAAPGKRQWEYLQWYSPGPQDDVILFGESFRVVIKVKGRHLCGP